MRNRQFRILLSIPLSDWNLATLVSAERTSGATRGEGESLGLEKDTKEITNITGIIYLSIRFGRR